ncbi:Transposon Ty3-G Gag-Pol polyprotein [Sesamum angolense]|uniref:Transposon Ty3-G Gag-Pol polyprotein n=1 Tax=Sesamum angolense TaxID=2727404 RepID=A0AAE1WLZ8_9LAMI|nr:Transposon Ty3-G Gag-Pol polyprotein [Sesamum angolense]
MPLYLRPPRLQDREPLNWPLGGSSIVACKIVVPSEKPPGCLDQIRYFRYHPRQGRPTVVEPIALGAIRHFQEFWTLLNQFTGSQKLRKTELNLFVDRQKENEPLKDYLQRFNAAALELGAPPWKDEYLPIWFRGRSNTSARHNLTLVDPRELIQLKDMSSRVSCGGHTLRLQCYIGKTRSQCFPSSNLRIPHEDQVSYSWRCRIRKWRICIDFKDLNKACPRDVYPLPRIDQLVESTFGCKLLSMMNVSQGYYQIMLVPKDRKRGQLHYFCWHILLYGHAFRIKKCRSYLPTISKQDISSTIERNVEVYVNNMLVKSKESQNHVADLEEIFVVLRKYRLKLNLEKCAFGVLGCHFLVFMVTHRGIEVNPLKIKVILDMKAPTNVNEVQWLTGMIAHLASLFPKQQRKSYIS